MTDRHDRDDAPDEHAEDVDDLPLDPAAMLALVETQQRTIEARMAGFAPVIILTWGVVWTIGYLALWLIDGLAPAFQLPLPVAVVIFAGLLAVAIVISAVLGIRSSRGIRATRGDVFQGVVYGCSWSIGSIGIAMLGFALTVNGLDGELQTFFYSSTYTFFVGVMYLASGAIWLALPSALLGLWTIAIAVVAPFFGYPGNYLFLALAGGVVLLAFGFVALAWTARLRRKAREVSRP